MTGRVHQRVGDPSCVRPIEPARRVPKVDGDAFGDARRNAQDLSLARRTAKAPGLERPDRHRPVDEGHRRIVRCAVENLDGLGNKVAPRQPGTVRDQQLDGGLSAEHSLRVLPQRRREVLKAGSK